MTRFQDAVTVRQDVTWSGDDLVVDTWIGERHEQRIYRNVRSAYDAGLFTVVTSR